MILLFQTVRIAIWNLIWGAAGSTGLIVPLTRQYSPVACAPVPSPARAAVIEAALRARIPYLESLNTPAAQLSSDLLGRCSCGTGSAFAASGTSPGVPGAGLGVGDMLSGVTP